MAKNKIIGVIALLLLSTMVVVGFNGVTGVAESGFADLEIDPVRARNGTLTAIITIVGLDAPEYSGANVTTGIITGDNSTEMLAAAANDNRTTPYESLEIADGKATFMDTSAVINENDTTLIFVRLSYSTAQEVVNLSDVRSPLAAENDTLIITIGDLTLGSNVTTIEQYFWYSPGDIVLMMNPPATPISSEAWIAVYIGMGVIAVALIAAIIVSSKSEHLMVK